MLKIDKNWISNFLSTRYANQDDGGESMNENKNSEIYDEIRLVEVLRAALLLVLLFGIELGAVLFLV